MARRSSPEISAGSMADIAFLLLIFFLVTTTMEKESGIMRILPELQNEITQEVNKRNVIDILVNDNNKILFKGEPINLSQVKPRLMEMILNESDNPNWPKNHKVSYENLESLVESAREKLKNADEVSKPTKEKSLEKAQQRLTAYEIFGNDFKKSEHVVSVQSTRGAEYNTYIELNDQILQAYKGLKERLAKKRLQKNWKELTSQEKDLLNIVYPTSISEAETVQGATR